MALIKSTILAQISGSINGTTFAHNRGGAYARSRSLVSNPQTIRQSEVRTAMATLSAMWRDSLTQTQRDQWNAYGASVSVINRLGDTISLSGIAAFNRVNLFRVATLDDTPVLDPPGASAVPDGITIPSFVSGQFLNPVPQTYDVTVTSDPSTYFGFALYYSAPLSPGIQYFRGPYAGRVIEDSPASVNVSFTWPSMPSTSGTYIATKVTMYDVASQLPIWTVHVPPRETQDV